jgi:hypothetical protein
MTTSSTSTPTVKVDSLQSSDDAEWVALDEILGASLFVRPIDYPPYTAARQALFKRLGRAFKDEPIPEKVLITSLGKLYAEHILLDWKGFDMPYSKEDAIEKMSEWTWRKLTRQVEWAAGKLTSVNAEFVEDAGKNSGPRSATS